MSLNSVSRVPPPQLLFANGQLAGNRDRGGLAFVDFVGLYGKSSQRSRRRIGAATWSDRIVPRSLVTRNWNSIQAALDLERERVAANAPAHQSADFAPKVRSLPAGVFCFDVTVVLRKKNT